MGYTTYSVTSRAERAERESYFSAPISQTFKQRKLTQAMDPKNVVVRESRDSEAHPNSIAIIIALDVTGSMLNVPAEFVKTGLPTIMTNIIQAGTPDPQVLLMGIGDQEYDDAPLQVGQFESGDEELDKWLTEIYLEAGGGANDGEGYILAWYFAANHTSIDCYKKRNTKGFLFTIGDEKPLDTLSSFHANKIMGGQHTNYDIKDLLKKAQETYNVYHIHVKETGAGMRKATIEVWKELLGQNALTVERHTEIPQLISTIVATKQDSEAEVPSMPSTDTKHDVLDDIEML